MCRIKSRTVAGGAAATAASKGGGSKQSHSKEEANSKGEEKKNTVFTHNSVNTLNTVDDGRAGRPVMAGNLNFREA